MIKAALYIRVSTAEQAEAGYSVGEQRERLLAYCKAKDYAVYDVYIDGGYSGSNLDRPAIKKLRADIGKFNMVLVYKLDRLSRSQIDILDLIERTFLPNGIDFVSMSEAFDTSTPFGRAMVGILGVFAQLEREQIKERTAMGKKARAKEGKFHGGGYFPIGYDYIDDKLIINKYEAEQVRLIFEMAAENKSINKILNALKDKGYKTRYGEWHYSRISRALKLETYKGQIKFEDIVIENAHEPIISVELFNKVNNIRSARTEKLGKANFQATTLLSGLIWCAKCNARYGTRSAGHNPVRRYHACYSRAFPHSIMAKVKGCKNKIWKIEQLEEAIINKVQKVMFEESHFENLSNDNKTPSKNTQHDGIKIRVDQIDKEIKKFMDLYALGTIPTEVLSQRIDELYTEKTNLLKTIDESNTATKKSKSINVSEFKELIQNMGSLWNLSNLEQKRLILSSLIRKIIINDDDIRIEWMFEEEY
jgi:site-specific DNA recombinase